MRAACRSSSREQSVCTSFHTFTLCQAMESFDWSNTSAASPLYSSDYGRTGTLHSHVLWAAIAAKLMDFKTMFMTGFELREKVMDLLQAISGNRVNYSMNRIGGVRSRILTTPLNCLRWWNHWSARWCVP